MPFPSPMNPHERGKRSSCAAVETVYLILGLKTMYWVSTLEKESMGSQRVRRVNQLSAGTQTQSKPPAWDLTHVAAA